MELLLSEIEAHQGSLLCHSIVIRFDRCKKRRDQEMTEQHKLEYICHIVCQCLSLPSQGRSEGRVEGAHHSGIKDRQNEG